MNSQTNPAIVMNTINRMQQQINALTEYVSHLSPGGRSVNKMSFEIEVYQDSESNPYYYSPLSLSERANLFRKITGRQLCAVGYEVLSYASGASPYIVYTTMPDGVYRYLGDGSLDNPSMILIDAEGAVGQWTFVDRDNIFDDKTYHAGEAFMYDNSSSNEYFVTSELPGDKYPKVMTFIFDFYE